MNHPLKMRSDLQHRLFELCGELRLEYEAERFAQLVESLDQTLSNLEKFDRRHHDDIHAGPTIVYFGD